MKRTHIFRFGFAVVLTLCTLAAARAQTWDNINGTPPPSSVENWTRVSVLGKRTILYMILWISPQKFERQPFEWHLALQTDEYRRVQSLRGSFPCLDRDAAASELHPLQISEFTAGKGQTDCILSNKISCAYLIRLAGLPGIRGIAKKEELVHDLADEIGCS